MPDGVEVYLYTVTNDRGLEAGIITYGGAIQSLKVPDRSGALGDVVLGFDTLEQYVSNPRYFGAVVGRYANRIARGRFSLNGVEYQLAQNDEGNHLHGGFKGFDKRVWKAQDEVKDGSAVLHLSYFSADGEEGYPGNLNAYVDYVLRDDELSIEYRATTDRDTIVNLSNHSYFNLKGEGTILDHELMLRADNFTPVGEDLIPTGEIQPAEGTRMDFRKSRPIASGGYDHNFVLNDWSGSLRSVARLHEPTSGRVMEILTTQPGIQFYSGNFLDGSYTGKYGFVYEKYAALCLEPQHFPDSPNQPNFPSTVLRAGEEYHETTVLRFTSA